MRYRSEDLKRLQETELEILREIIRVCDENDISYFTYAGTTLGLMRHGGFIPWDDDIDIGMMRPDYERFLQIAPSALKEDFFLQHDSTEPGTPTYHAKVRKNGTLFVEAYCRDLDIHKGIFVDVFPFDYAPDDDRQRERYGRRVRRARSVLASKCTPYVTVEKNRYKKAAKQVIRSILHFCLIPVPKRLLIRRLDRVLQQYNAAPTHHIGTVGYAVNFYRTEDVFPLVERQFETVAVKSPNHADAILTAGYGDWRRLPPAEEQYNHAPVELRF